jgi:signal transduction histidine kinase/CheY-like chemotaxis protein
MEFTSIIAAFAIFVIGWNSRSFTRSNLLVFLSILFLPVGCFDLLHTLSYKGMGVFSTNDANLATQYWIAARSLQAGSFFVGALWIRQIGKFQPEKTLRVFLFLGAVIALTIYPAGFFPDCYVEGSGLTPFKIWSEIIICTLLSATGVLIWYRRQNWDQRLLTFLLPSLLLFILSELAFTLYHDVYGFFNFVGHVLKFGSFIFIYFGLIEGSLKRPYSILFHDLVSSEEKLLKELEERIIAEEKAQLAGNEAQEANSAKSRFLANIAHEIRTPLNAILGLTELTLASDLKEEPKEYVRMLQSSGASLRGLVDNVLDMSKIEAGKFDFLFHPFSLSQKVQDLIKPLDVLARGKGVKLSSRVSHDIPEILEGDSQRLRQVLNNLIVNAIKFTSEGEISVIVSRSETSSADEETIWLDFQVHDTGIGIPEDRIKDLFEEFSQIGKPFSREYGGSGLGLAISKEIVEKMGGTIGVEAQEGKGSLFHFSVPFKTIAENSLAINPAKSEIPSAELTKKADFESNPIKVLLAEDDLINQKVMTTILARKGYLVSAVSDGFEAVREAASGNFDCILMDIRMPNMDGLAATRDIRENQNPANPPTRIIGVSASPFEEEREKCLNAGMDDYLSKPVHWNLLFSKIEQCRKDLEAQKTYPEDGTVDFSDLISAVGENQGALVEMIDEFLQICPDRVRTIQEAIQSQDGSSLEKNAHGFKSAVGIWGKSKAFEKLTELEEAGRQNDFHRVEKLFEPLPEELENLNQELVTLRNSLSQKMDSSN